MIFTQQAVSLIYQLWIHTERVKKVPAWFEFFFNTPSHHRVHHGANEAYLDRSGGTQSPARHAGSLGGSQRVH
jgi:sterol desaturase/sphingolipid hydroxylase (fatty acid hydroxylase superfamily)